MERQRSEFDDLLQSCDLYDTPFDHTHFEGDVTALKDQLGSCDKVRHDTSHYVCTYSVIIEDSYYTRQI